VRFKNLFLRNFDGLMPFNRASGRLRQQEDVAVSDIDRRSAFALGLMTVALVSRAAGAQTPNEGRLIAPGVRVVNLSERASLLPAYKTLKMRDVVIQPGAATPDNVMMNDMLCHMTEGELPVQPGTRALPWP
jgi:hypothetical protein